MAITTLSTAASNSSGTQTTSVTFSHTVPTGGTDTILIVGATYGTNTTCTATYGGTSMIQEITQGTTSRSCIFYLVNPATGANNVALSFSGSTEFVAAGAFAYQGVDQTTPMDAAGVGATGGSVNITTVTDGAWAADCARSNVESSIVVGAGQTQRYNWVNPDQFAVGHSTEPKATAGAVTMSWSGGLSAIAAVAMRPASTGSAVTVMGVVATASALALAPIVTSADSVTVSDVASTISAQALVPSISTAAPVTISAVTSAVTARALIPAITSADAVTVSDIAATISSLALVPVITSADTVTVSPVVSTVTVQGLVPVVISADTVTITGVVAAVSALALAPVVTSADAVYSFFCCGYRTSSGLGSCYHIS